jgi:hypothetical protein
VGHQCQPLLTLLEAGDPHHEKSALIGRITGVFQLECRLLARQDGPDARCGGVCVGLLWPLRRVTDTQVVAADRVAAARLPGKGCPGLIHFQNSAVSGQDSHLGQQGIEGFQQVTPRRER